MRLTPGVPEGSKDTEDYGQGQNPGRASPRGWRVRRTGFGGSHLSPAALGHPLPTCSDMSLRPEVTDLQSRNSGTYRPRSEPPCPRGKLRAPLCPASPPVRRGVLTVSSAREGHTDRKGQFGRNTSTKLLLAATCPAVG